MSLREYRWEKERIFKQFIVIFATVFFRKNYQFYFEVIVYGFQKIKTRKVKG